MEQSKTPTAASMQSFLDLGRVGGVREDEFVKDDCIYCKKCGTPRTCYIEPFKRWVRCICKCQSEELKDKEKKEQQQRQQVKFERLLKASLLGERYYNVSFENTDLNRHASFTKAFERCKKYCENSDEVLANGYGIYLWGDSGSGKTHLMACMVNYLTRNFEACLFTNFFEITRELLKRNNSFNNDASFENMLAEVPFLFIDDLGTERVQKDGQDMWLQEKIYDIVNKRYNNKKPTIFSSNNSLQQLIEEKGLMQKTVDRILEMSSAIMKVEGDSYRFKMRDKNLPF